MSGQSSSRRPRADNHDIICFRWHRLRTSVHQSTAGWGAF
jgi:hypothetical protein